jgi:hypothetical protein
MRRLLLVLALLLPLTTLAQQDVEGAKRGITAVEGLLKLRPNDPVLWFYLARFQSQAGEKAAALASLEKLAEVGEGFLPPRDGFEKAWDDAAFQAARARLEAKLPRLDYAPAAFVLEDTTLIPEGIAHDNASNTFFMGSIAGKVLKITELGGPAEFAGKSHGLDQVLGLAVDSPRRVLYVVSTSALTIAGEKNRRNAVFAFDVDSGRLLHRHDVPDARQLNDVAVAFGGRVFTSDSASGAVYELNVKGPGPARELLPPDRIRGTNGLAASPDGKRLYLAHSTGLAVVDVDTKEVVRVNNETRENIGAIDGLYEFQGQLIGVQNLTTPGRVILITLSRDGKAVSKVQTMLSHHHTSLYEPTTGVVTPRGFYLLAATGVSHFNREGQIERAESVPKPTVVRIPLPR